MPGHARKLWNYQLIKPVFTGKGVDIVCRREDGKKLIMHDSTHDSYFYVNEKEFIPSDPRIIAVEYADGRNRHAWIPFPKGGSIEGVPVKRIFVSNPNDVPELRDEFKSSMEADIKYTRRYIIDRGITGGFDDNLKPINDFSMNPNICIIDIEVFSRKKQNIEMMKRKAKKPIVMVGFRFDNKKPIQLVLDNEQKRHEIEERDDVVILYFRSEIKLLTYFWRILKKGFPDVLSGWNVKFDIEYIENRCNKLIETLNTTRKGNKLLTELKALIDENILKHILVFDLMDSYNQLYEPVSKGLKNVEKDEGIERKIPITGKNFAEVYLKDQEKARFYNYEDIVNTYKINQLKQVIEFFWGNKNFAGLEDLEGARYVGRLVDTITLRLASGEYALPSSPSYTKEEREALGKFKGALVLPSVIGIHEWVGTIDFSRFYPTIMLIKAKLIGFAQNLIPKVVKFVWRMRDAAEKIMDSLTPGTDAWESAKARFMSRKFTLNGVYGKIGNPDYRLYDKIKAGKITAYCRAGLKVLQRIARALGFEVKAGDTDSIFIELVKDILKTLKDPAEIVDWVAKVGLDLVEKFNYALQKIFKSKELKVELETIWNPICFLRKKKKEDPAKKKYFGKMVWKDGKNLVALGTVKAEIKGMESVKRDTAKLTKVVFNKMYDYILNNQTEKVLPLLRTVYINVKNGKYNTEAIAIGKGLSKHLTKYVANTDYIRGSKYANEHFYKAKIMGAGVRAFMFFIERVLDPKLPQTDVICFSEVEDFDFSKFKINYYKTMERVLEKPLENMLELTGLTWKRVRGEARLSVLLE